MRVALPDRIEAVIKIEKADPSMRCGTYLLGISRRRSLF